VINPFIIKKYGALLLSGLLSTIGFSIGLMILKSFWMGLLFMGLGLAIGVLIGAIMLNNPFQLILEGQGVLCIDLNSTGILRPFVMRVKQPFIEGKIDNELATDVFDRECVFSLAAPVAAGRVQQGEGKDGITRVAIVLSEDDYNKARFGMFHFPTIIYNSQIRSIISKDWFAEKEKGAFAEHGILYLNRKLEELTSATRDFGRYVVESLKPKSLSLPSWTWVVVIIILAILAFMFAPNILQALGGAKTAVTGAAGNVAGAVQPAG
jgi:hypothetical protein